jgi:hypothetical protein
VAIQRLALRLLAFAARHLNKAESIWLAAACVGLAAEAVTCVPVHAAMVDDLGFAVNFSCVRNHIELLRSSLAELGVSLCIQGTTLQHLQGVLDTDECMAM